MPCAEAEAEAEERKEASARPRGSGRSPSAARHYCQRPPLSSPSPPVRLLRCWHHLPRPHRRRRRQAAAPWPPPRTEAAPRASSPRRGTGEGGEGRAPPVCGCTRPSLARLLSSLDRRRIVSFYPGRNKAEGSGDGEAGGGFRVGVREGLYRRDGGPGPRVVALRTQCPQWENAMEAWGQRQRARWRRTD